MKLFQRGDSASDVLDDEEDAAGEASKETEQRTKAYTPAKGRATPKRRDAEPHRRGPAAPPPRTQREALKRSKTERGQNRSTAAERRERMAAGDDRYVTRRDKGPVRAYARDVIDSRRNLMGVFMPLALVIVIAFFLPQAQSVLTLVVLVFLVAMLTEGLYLGILVNRKVRAKFPDTEERPLSLGWYVFIRATQIRKLRMPKPQVKPGEKV